MFASNTQKRYANNLSIDIILKTKTAKSIIINFKMSKNCADRQTDRHTHTQLLQPFSYAWVNYAYTHARVNYNYKFL